MTSPPASTLESVASLKAGRSSWIACIQRRGRTRGSQHGAVAGVAGGGQLEIKMAAESYRLLAVRCCRSKACRRFAVLAVCLALWSQLLDTQDSRQHPLSDLSVGQRLSGGVRRLTRAVGFRRSDQEEADNGTMFRRKRQILQACQTYYQEPHLRHLVSRVPMVSRDQMYVHCPVTKAASTFWTRFLLALNHSGQTYSPFSIPLNKSTRKQVTSLLEIHPLAARMDFLSAATKVIFVRDPYSRMLSAYVDKVFAPNPYYWRSWGRRAMAKFRKGSRATKCGSDVTFAEVMAFAASGMFKNDIHFHSVFRECQPCSFQYDFVGKMETFGQDVQHLASRLQLSNTAYFSSQQFKDDFTKDAIEDSINSPWGWLPEIKSCMTMAEAGKRVWRKLQIRGIISRRVVFPFSDSEAESLTSAAFIQSALSAYHRSTDKEELRRQKRDALVEAFRTVDLKTLNTLRNVFVRDFELFEYEQFPDDLFERTNKSVNTGAFKWDTEWKE